jgi:hypothetical protein
MDLTIYDLKTTLDYSNQIFAFLISFYEFRILFIIFNYFKYLDLCFIFILFCRIFVGLYKFISFL